MSHGQCVGKSWENGYFIPLKPGFHIDVSVARKKFIGQIEFILSRTTSCSCGFFVLSICTGGFHKVVSVP